MTAVVQAVRWSSAGESLVSMCHLSFFMLRWFAVTDSSAVVLHSTTCVAASILSVRFSQGPGVAVAHYMLHTQVNRGPGGMPPSCPEVCCSIVLHTSTAQLAMYSLASGGTCLTCLLNCHCTVACRCSTADAPGTTHALPSQHSSTLWPQQWAPSWETVCSTTLTASTSWREALCSTSLLPAC